jgi:hypothetical protein
MAVNLSPIGGVAGQFFDNNGNPLAGGKIFTYAAGTTTNQATYTSASGVIAHSNPIILDAAGRVPSGEIWLTDGLQYKFVIKTSTDVLIGTYDNIIGINSNFINFLTETEIQTATAGQTVFTLTTMDYQPGTNSLSVFVDGVNQYDGVTYAYVETSSTVVTFTAGLHVGALVKFTTAQTLSSGVTDASLVTYDPPFTGSVPTNVEAKLSEYVSVKDFGAVGDGVTDDTVAIQAAIDSGAKLVTAIAGETYKITSTLTITVAALQLDFNQSTLLLDDATGSFSHILIGDGITQVNGVRLSNIVFTRTQVATGGYAIDTDYVGVLNVSNCRIFGDNKIYGGIKIYKGIIVNIANNYIQNCVLNDIYLEGAGTGADRTIDVTIIENRIEGSQFGLSTWDFVEGLYCRDNIFFNQTNTCASINASTNANALASFKLQQNDFDTAPAGLYVRYVNNIQISDNWFSNNSQKCLVIETGVDGGVIADNEIISIIIGIELSGINLAISGNHCTGLGLAVLFQASASHIVFSNNVIQNNNAINIAANPTYVLIANNDLNNSVSTITGTGGTGTNIEGNLGDPARGSSSFVTVGSSPFTYTTGPRPTTVNIFAGTVTNITVGGNLVSGSVLDTVSYTLPPRTSITVTYSVIPIMSVVFL